MRPGSPSAALAFGYLLGSIPFGVILTRFAGLGDVRAIGSGNIGATNVLRTGRKGLAAATLLGDALKGTVAVLIAWNWGPTRPSLAAVGAFLGHLFPVWLGFKGGKGVATFLGCLSALHLAGRRSPSPRLARGRLRLPLLLAGGARRERGDAGRARGRLAKPDGGGVRAARRPAVVEAPREHRTARGRERKAGSDSKG